MNERNSMKETISVRVLEPAPADRLDIGGYFHYRLTEPDGGVREFVAPNLVVNTGRNYITQASLLSETPIGANGFQIGLMTSAVTSIAAGDTMASHAGWTELPSYSQTTRRTWASVASSVAGGIGNNASPAVFSINSSGMTLGGAFLTTSPTKSGTTGTLIAAGSVAATSLTSGSTLEISYNFGW